MQNRPLSLKPWVKSRTLRRTMLSEATPMHTASERLKRVRDVQTGSYNKVPNSNTDGVTKVWPLKMYHRFV